MHFAEFDNRSLIEVSGDDAETFLDNLITCNVLNLNVGDANFGALLTPQGKILFDFFLLRSANGFMIDTHESLGEALFKRLVFYRLRAKVEIVQSHPQKVIAYWGEPLKPNDAFVKDPRHQQLGYRIYNGQQIDGQLSDYQARRIELGMPEGGSDFEYGDTYPHEVLMDQFGGVDFKKGCYVGQEVVSRMQHRGTTKKRIVHVQGDTPLPASNTLISADGKPAGTLGSISGKSGLALLRLDRASKAEKLEADGVLLTPSVQSWVNFSMPETD